MHRQKDSKGVPPRLRDELTNRRQYLACLHNLQEDCSTLRQRADESVGAYGEVLEELRGIVGQRTSVPKEQVYPKFDRLAKVWKEMEEDLAQVNARLAVLGTLLNYKQSFHTRLRAHDVASARQSLSEDPGLQESVEAETTALQEMSDAAMEGVMLDVQDQDPLSPSQETIEGGGVIAGGMSPIEESPEQGAPMSPMEKEPEAEKPDEAEAGAEAEAPAAAAEEATPADADGGEDAAAPAEAAEAAAVLEAEAATSPAPVPAVEVTTGPGGMRMGPGGAKCYLYDAWRQNHSVGQLAMGKFCPWTVAHRDALLLFGRPPHGVIEYNSAFYAFATPEALEASIST